MSPVDEDIYHMIINEFHKDTKLIERYRKEQVRREIHDTRIKEDQKKEKELALNSLEDQSKLEIEQQRGELFKTLEVGNIMEGRVKNITDYGAFVDLGDIDGLLHIKDLSWGRVNHPSEIVSIDDTLSVKIIDVDKGKKRVSLGLKQLTPNPLENMTDNYPNGTKISGKIISMTNYGAFVEIEPGLEGLIHVSEMSWIRHVKNPSEMYSLGDEVEAVILNIDNNKSQISLGVKQLTIDPWKKIDEYFPIGKIINGKVATKKEPGILYLQLENDLMALLHLSDLDWVYPLAELRYEEIEMEENIEVQVVEVDPINRQLSVGIKQMTENPIYNKEWQSLEIGDSIQGEIYKALENYSIVKISEIIYGKLIHQVKVSSVGQKIELIVSSKNIESGLIGVVYPETVIKVSSSENKAVQDHKLHKTKFTPHDSQLWDINSLKRSEYWNFIDIVGQDYLTKSFANNPELLSRVFKKEMVLHIWFDPLDQSRVWERFTLNIVPAIIDQNEYKGGTEEDIKNALDIISRENFWYLQFERERKHNFNLFNENINLYGIINEDRKFFLRDIKYKTHPSAKRDKRKLSKRLSGFSLNNPIIIHHKYDNIVDSSSIGDIARLLEEKSYSFDFIEKAKKAALNDLLKKGKHFQTFEKYLNYQMEYERAHFMPDEIIINKSNHLSANKKLGLNLECFAEKNIPYQNNQHISIHLMNKSGDIEEERITSAEVDIVDSEKMSIHVHGSLDKRKLDKRFVTKSNLSLRHYKEQIKLINQFIEGEGSKDNPLYSVLRAPETLTPPNDTELNFYDKKLSMDKSGLNRQPEAVRKAVGNKNVYLIQGPPGTGKTTVITEIVRQLIEKKERILVTGQTQVSVDNVLNKIKTIDDIEILRIGKVGAKSVDPNSFDFMIDVQREAFKKRIKELSRIKSSVEPLLEKLPKGEVLEKEYIQDIIAPHCKDLITSMEMSDRLKNIFHNEIDLFLDYLKGKNVEKVKKEIGLIKSWEAQISVFKKIWEPLFYKSRDVVFGTCIGSIMDKNFVESNEDSPFDTIIIDEAAKANLGETLSPISMGKKVILVGDHQQLPPHVPHDLVKDFKDEHQHSIDRRHFNLNFEKYKVGNNYKALVNGKTELGIFCNLGKYSGLIPNQSLFKNANTPIALQNDQVISVIVKKVEDKEKRFILDLDEDPIEKAITTSLFEFLQEILPASHKIRLNIQHRMHPLIGGFISDTFYRSDIKNGKDTILNEINMRPPYDAQLLFHDTSRDKNSRETRLENGGVYNELEAQLIAHKILPELLEEDAIVKKDIAIVTPYKEQLNLIKRKLDKSGLYDIEVATLDSFQGREVKIMIFSFTRSNRGFKQCTKCEKRIYQNVFKCVTDGCGSYSLESRGTVGFMDDAQRLNVAFSRPQSMLILVGNSITLTNELSHVNEYYVDLFRKLYSHVSRNGKILKRKKAKKVKYKIGDKFEGIVDNIIDLPYKAHGVFLKAKDGQTGMIYIKSNSQLPKIDEKIKAFVIPSKKPGRISLSINKSQFTQRLKRRNWKKKIIKGEVLKYDKEGVHVKIDKNKTGIIMDPNGMLRKSFKKGDKINVKIKYINKKKIELNWIGK